MLKFKDDFEYYSSQIHTGRKCNYTEEKKGCVYEEPWNAQNQTISNGYLLCGKRSESNYLTASRPRDSDALSCKDKPEFCLE
jgi:hypothetical protein